jgi:hypothetical protein
VSLLKILCSPWGMSVALTKIRAAYSRCHSPRRSAKLKQFTDLLESGERSSRRRRVQRSTVRSQISKVRAEATCSKVDSGSLGGPSFVAVVQSTDLRHCHD